MNHPSVSIVIPAYNESGRIRPLLSELTDSDLEFIFVCDGTDDTADIIQDYKKNHPDMTIKCLTFPHRLGKGGGVRAGFTVASGSLVGLMDADNSTKVSELVRLSRRIGDHDGVIGSRHLPGQVLQRKQPLFRRIQSRIFNGLIRLLFGLPFYDTQCGAKIFKKEALDAVLPHLRSTGFEFDVELLWQLSRKGYSLIEVPVIWNDTLDSRLRLSDTLSMLVTLFRIRFHLLS
jgi:dolichol-phosphate mannosyltransferase